MMLPLHLIHSDQLGETPEAWFLPGGSAERWVDELVACGLAQADTRVFLVPRSFEDRACAGLLVVPAVTGSISRPAAALGCRRVAGRLFAPVDAVLTPPVTDAEVRGLCGTPVSFLHPVYGLSSFEEGAAFRISDLLRAPAEAGGNWNLARAGAAALPELNSIVFLQPPSAEDLFGEAPKEIGSEPPADLPPTADEPKQDPLSTAGRKVGQFLLKRLSDALEHVPESKTRRTSAGGVGNWVKRSLFNLEQRLEHIRNKELHRLASLFDTDPETALRHAVPMNQFAHRGIAPPGFRLGPHSLDFDPNHLGGGPADFWHAPQDLVEVLRRRYREMADRELQLGRHRRAAYIYAVLLGDLVSAASALKKGRHFRQAAVLYEEHLNNRPEAAVCLEEGGFLAEALERYEKLGSWLKVADLHERLGNIPAAQTALRRVVQERLAQADVLGAADLLEKRLNAPDEALELLLGAWPSSYQAANCLAAAFQLLGRLGRHEAALDRLDRIGRERISTALARPLLTVLDGVARNYPHDRARHKAADLSRVVIASQLNRPGTGAQTAGPLLEFLVRLAPQDRLLPRDSLRYLEQLRAADLHASPTRPAPLPGAKPIVDRRFELPRQIQWRELRREWHWFYALGVTPKRLTLVRGVWDGGYQSLSWAYPATAVNQGFVFEPTAEQGDAVALARPAGPSLAQKRFPAAYQFYDKDCVAGTPSWLPTDGFPVAFGEDAVWTMYVANSRAVLSCYEKTRGQLLQTIDITQQLLEDADRTEKTRPCIAALRTGVAVALGNRLVLAGGGNRLVQVELPGQVVRLLPTIPSTRQGVAAMLEHGATMYWVGAHECMELDRDLGSPLGAFVPGGPLVLISGLRGLLLDVDSRGVQHATRFELAGQRPVGVTATSYPGEFGVLGERGEMTVYRMPR